MKSTVRILLLVALLLSACIAQVPQATVKPAESTPDSATEDSMQKPMVEPSEEMPTDVAALMANDWQWTSFTGPVDQFDVETPENYRLRFLDDGTISVVADCNNAFLPYTDDEGSLTVSAGAMTLVLCPGDSRSEQFMGLLAGAARYFFEDGNLFIDLMADGGTLEFAPIAPLTLTSNPWQWLRFTGNSGVYDIEMPENYTLTFNDDGTVNIVADCNRALGEYTDAEGDMKISIGPATLALCPGDSRSEKFVQLLGGAQRYFIDGENLFIVVEEDGGTMSFVAADAEQTSGNDQDATTENFPADLAAQLDAWLNAQVYSQGGDPKAAVPGLVLLVETPQGRYLKAAGVSSLEEGTPMKVDDRLEIGSNTKSFTAVLLLQLQEEGVLSLDDKLSKWLPELATEIPNSDQITLRQLANHTSGIAECCNEIIGAGLADPPKLALAYTPEALVRNAIEHREPDFAPGEGFKYSNTNYDLMGLVAEAAASQSLAELYKERIFKPLGLETAVLLEGVPRPGEITSQGYYYAGEMRMNVTNWNASQGWAAGANAMTAADLATYAQGLATGKLLKNPESLAQMLTFNPDGAPYLAPYGLGLMDFGDGYWGHGGTTPGFQSLWYINPDEGIVVVGLSNAGSYVNWNFLNVLNILTGKGVQPIIGEYIGPAVGADGTGFPITWEWIRTVNFSGSSSEVNEFEPVVTLSLRKNGFASVSSTTCGPVEGSFTASAPDSLSFDLDATAVTCPANDPLLELLGLLDTIASWRFENGEMVIVLEDSTELGFRNPY